MSAGGQLAVRSQPFLKDVPQNLDGTGPDWFGHRDYVATLVGAVRDIQANATLGLFAPWGTGKTGILATAADRLRKDNWGAVVLDVWRYEQDAPLRRQFLRGLVQGLRETGSLKMDFKLDEFDRELDADVTDFEPRLDFQKEAFKAGTLRLLLVVLVVALVALVLSPDQKTGQQLLSGGIAFVVFVLTGYAGLLRVQQVQHTRKRLADADDFEDHFSTVLRQGLAEPNLLIGIDNLDRCSPERVTEMLSTIKTFLQPRGGQPRVVFVIAADDSALRRHLIAQELANSLTPDQTLALPAAQPANGPEDVDDPVAADDEDDLALTLLTSEAHVPDDVRDAVDEYLRKFFSGVIHLNDLLVRDVNGFTAAQLEGFADAHEMDAEARGQLVQLIAWALKRNPRRIKQFVNGLELRMRLLKERQAHQRIQISPDPLMVAKLAVLEEQFPSYYQQIRQDPRRLAHWHERARTVSHGEREERAWLSFLWRSAPIGTKHLSAYLRQQQSEAEVKLDRYADFEEALRAGSAEQVDGLMADGVSSEEAARYRAVVPDLLNETVDRGYFTDATQIVRASVEADHLKPLASQVLGQALGHPSLRGYLTDIRSEALLAAADGLQEPAFDEVLGLLIDQFAVAGGESRYDLSEVFADRYSDFSDANERKLRESFRDSNLLSDLENYLPLAENAPQLLPHEPVLEHCFARLGEESSFDSSSIEWRMLRALLRDNAELIAEHLPRAAGEANRALAGLRDDQPDEHATVIEQTAEMADSLRRFAGIELQDQLEQLWQRWDPTPHQLRPEIMDLAGALLRVATRGNRDYWASRFADRFFEAEPGAALAWMASKKGVASEGFRKPVETRVEMLLSGEGESDAIQQATSVVADLPLRPRGKLVNLAITLAFDNGRYQRGVWLLTKFAETLKERVKTRVRQLLSGTVNALDEHPEELLAALDSIPPKLLDPGDRQRRARAVTRAAVRDIGNWPAAMATVEEHDPGLVEPAAGQMVRRLIEEEVEFEQPDNARIAFVLEHVEDLAADQVEAVGNSALNRLQSLASPPYAGNSLQGPATILGAMESADTDLRGSWVDAMISVEQDEPSAERKEEILQGVARLSWDGRTAAARSYTRRLKTLRCSEDAALSEMAARLLKEHQHR